MLLMQDYEPPVLACAVNEVLASMKEESFSIVLPIVVAAPKLA